MDSLEPELIDRLRAMAGRGEHPSAMLRAIISHLAPATVDRLLLVSYFSTAFCFKDGQGHPIFGWFADGSGELKDSDINRLMTRRIQQTRAEWDRAAPAGSQRP
jgi:hypothetical protein